MVISHGYVNLPEGITSKPRFKHEKWELIQWAWRFREKILYHQSMVFYSKTAGPGRSKRLKLLAFVNNGGYRNLPQCMEIKQWAIHYFIPFGFGGTLCSDRPSWSVGEVWWFTTGEWNFKFHRIGHVSTTLCRFQELCFILFPEEILIYLKLIVSIFYYIPIHIYI